MCHSLPSFPSTSPRTINIIIIFTYESYPSHLTWKEDEDFDKFIFILLREIRTANKLLNQVCSLMFSSLSSFSCFLIFLSLSHCFFVKTFISKMKEFFFLPPFPSSFRSSFCDVYVNTNVYKSTPKSEFEWNENFFLSF